MGKTTKLKLGKRLKELRKRCGYTQERLAHLANIDYKYLPRIEGKNPAAFKLSTLEKLAKAFNISLSKFLDFKEAFSCQSRWRTT